MVNHKKKIDPYDDHQSLHFILHVLMYMYLTPCEFYEVQYNVMMCEEIQIQNPFLTAQSTQIKSVISVPIKDFIHHYPRALFNDIPRVGTHFNDIPGSGRTFTTYLGRGAV